MKYKYLLILVSTLGLSVGAQSLDVPTGITIFSTQTLTNVYTASTALDVQSYGAVSVVARVPTAQANAVAQIKPQWSNDNTNWADQSVLTTNAIVGSETPSSITSKQVTMQMTNTTSTFVELYPRNARYFRVVVASTNVFTTATLNIVAQKLNNGSIR